MTTSPMMHATLYRPDRLTGESQASYHHRQRISQLAARLTKVIKNHKASPARLMRRKLVDALGIRQAKKWFRAAKAARRQAEKLQDSTVTMPPVQYTGPAVDSVLRTSTVSAP